MKIMFSKLYCAEGANEWSIGHDPASRAQRPGRSAESIRPGRLDS